MAYMMLYRRILKFERGKYLKGMKRMLLRFSECVMKLMRILRSEVVLLSEPFVYQERDVSTP
jgi:hypothetical protein